MLLQPLPQIDSPHPLLRSISAEGPVYEPSQRLVSICWEGQNGEEIFILVNDVRCSGPHGYPCDSGPGSHLATMHDTTAEAKPAPTSSKNPPPSPAKKFTRTEFNFVLDTFLLLNFLALLFSTIVVRFIFPLGEAAAGWQLWGLSLGDWLEIQFVTLGILSAAILLHVMLHWNWVCGVVMNRLGRSKQSSKGREGVRTLYGVGLLIVILNVVGLAIALAMLMVRGPLD